MSHSSLLKHLEHLVSLYPHTEDQQSVKSALEYCKKICDDTGAFTNAKIYENQGVFSFVASTQNTKQPTLLLQGHIDVVHSPKGPIFTNDEDKIFGRGVWDMLFAVASYLTFIQHNSDKLPQLDIGIMLTGDEEKGGFYGAGWLTEEGFGGNTVFIPDSGEGFGDICIASKGAYNIDLIAHGKSHHGSRPWEGDGAANKLIHMVHELMDSFDHSNPENSTITVTSFESGGAINRGPAKASAHLDIRFKDDPDFKSIKDRINTICNKYGGEISNVIHADNLAINTASSEYQEFISIYEKHAQKTITTSKSHGGSDARFFSRNGNQVIMIRPDGGCAHSDEEFVVTQSLYDFYDLMEDFILKTAKIK